LLEKSNQDVKRRSEIEQFMNLCGESVIKNHVVDGTFKSKLNNVEFSLKENEDFFYQGFKNRNDY